MNDLRQFLRFDFSRLAFRQRLRDRGNSRLLPVWSSTQFELLFMGRHLDRFEVEYN
jgi:hypothetical protein